MFVKSIGPNDQPFSHMIKTSNFQGNSQQEFALSLILKKSKASEFSDISNLNQILLSIG